MDMIRGLNSLPRAGVNLSSFLKTGLLNERQVIQWAGRLGRKTVDNLREDMVGKLYTTRNIAEKKGLDEAIAKEDAVAMTVTLTKIKL